MIMVIQEADFLTKPTPSSAGAKPGYAASSRPEVIGEALIGNARGTWEDGEDGSGIIPSASKYLVRFRCLGTPV